MSHLIFLQFHLMFSLQSSIFNFNIPHFDFHIAFFHCFFRRHCPFQHRSRCSSLSPLFVARLHLFIISLHPAKGRETKRRPCVDVWRSSQEACEEQIESFVNLINLKWDQCHCKSNQHFEIGIERSDEREFEYEEWEIKNRRQGRQRWWTMMTTLNNGDDNESGNRHEHWRQWKWQQ